MVNPAPDFLGLWLPTHTVIEGASSEKGHGSEGKDA
jgi:hypothetical protein